MCISLTPSFLFTVFMKTELWQLLTNKNVEKEIPHRLDLTPRNLFQKKNFPWETGVWRPDVNLSMIKRDFATNRNCPG